MPSLRVLSVVLLVGMGAAVAAVGGVGESGEPGNPATAGLVIGADPTPTTPAVTGSLSPAVALGARAQTAPTSGPGFDVRAENQRPGTPGWRIGRAQGRASGLAGYAGAISVQPGEPVPLSVSADGPVRIRALRIGWYNGAGARQVWEGTLRAQPESAEPGQWQARGWADTSGWPEGHYLLRLDHRNAARYLPLTVRSADNAGRVVVLTSPITWAAENPADGSAESPATVSFDRPYTDGYGSGGFLQHDAGVVQLAERTGHRIGFLTDHDVATDPGLLKGAAAVLTGGNSRYWTASLRTAIREAGNEGTNLAFFGAGAGARQVRLVDSGRGLRISPANPAPSVRITGLRPSCPAGTGRTAGPDGDRAGWAVSNADWWGYRGAGVNTGDVVPGLVAGRMDRAATSANESPEPMQALSFSQVTCGSERGTSAQSGVYLARPSGAGVFTAGTGRWACALTAACATRSGKAVELPARSRRFTTRVTRNVINAFAEPAAGERFSATNSASEYAALR